jgi:hypothetical protein
MKRVGHAPNLGVVRVQQGVAHDKAMMLPSTAITAHPAIVTDDATVTAETIAQSPATP